MPVEEQRRQAVQELVEQAGCSEYVTTLSVERRIALGHYHFVDIARNVSGVGSVGTDGYMVLLMGEHDQDPLFLQWKEAQESVLAPYAGPGDDALARGARRARAADHASRERLVPRLVRPSEGAPSLLRPAGCAAWRAAATCATMTPRGLERYGRLCGACLARAHARSDQIARLSGYVGTGKTFADAIGEFALAYADQNESDYQALLASERDGRLVIQRDV